MVGLATLSTIVWILVIVLAATSDGNLNNDLNNELNDSQPSAIRVGLFALHVVVRLVS